MPPAWRLRGSCTSLALHMYCLAQWQASGATDCRLASPQCSLLLCADSDSSLSKESLSDAVPCQGHLAPPVRLVITHSKALVSVWAG